MGRLDKDVNNIVEETVAGILLDHPEFTANEIKAAAEKSLNEKSQYNFNFTERTYLNIKNRLYPNIDRNKPYDCPWSVGSCAIYPFTSTDIKNLIETGKIIENQADQSSYIRIVSLSDTELIKKLFNKRITVREAKWITILKTFIDEIISKDIKGEAKNLVILEIGRHYARCEQIAETMKVPFPDTALIDTDYFHEGKIDLKTIAKYNAEYAEYISRRYGVK